MRGDKAGMSTGVASRTQTHTASPAQNCSLPPLPSSHPLGTQLIKAGWKRLGNARNGWGRTTNPEPGVGCWHPKSTDRPTSSVPGWGEAVRAALNTETPPGLFPFQLKPLQGCTLISLRLQFWSRISHLYLIILKSTFSLRK